VVERNEPLVYWRGGWWACEHEPTSTYHQPPGCAPLPVPDWSTTLGTVRALERRGLLRVQRLDDVLYVHSPRYLTDAGREHCRRLGVP